MDRIRYCVTEQVVGMRDEEVSSVFYNGGCYFQERSKPDGRHCETKHLYNILATFNGCAHAQTI